MTGHTVAEFMTPCPFTIAPATPLAHAREIMRDRRIHHLPVVEHGRIVGVISSRDLHLLETLGGIDPELVLTARDAIVDKPLVVPPTAPLDEVATTMVDHGYGSVVVSADHGIDGVFTTSDALRALASL